MATSIAQLGYHLSINANIFQTYFESQFPIIPIRLSHSWRSFRTTTSKLTDLLGAGPKRPFLLPSKAGGRAPQGRTAVGRSLFLGQHGRDGLQIDGEAQRRAGHHKSGLLCTCRGMNDLRMRCFSGERCEYLYLRRLGLGCPFLLLLLPPPLPSVFCTWPLRPLSAFWCLLSAVPFLSGEQAHAGDVLFSGSCHRRDCHGELPPRVLAARWPTCGVVPVATSACLA